VTMAIQDMAFSAVRFCSYRTSYAVRSAFLETATLLFSFFVLQLDKITQNFWPSKFKFCSKT